MALKALRLITLVALIIPNQCAANYSAHNEASEGNGRKVFTKRADADVNDPDRGGDSGNGGNKNIARSEFVTGGDIVLDDKDLSDRIEESGIDRILDISEGMNGTGNYTKHYEFLLNNTFFNGNESELENNLDLLNNSLILFQKEVENISGTQNKTYSNISNIKTHYIQEGNNKMEGKNNNENNKSQNNINHQKSNTESTQDGKGVFETGPNMFNAKQDFEYISKANDLNLNLNRTHVFNKEIKDAKSDGNTNPKNSKESIKEGGRNIMESNEKGKAPFVTTEGKSITRYHKVTETEVNKEKIITGIHNEASNIVVNKQIEEDESIERRNGKDSMENVGVKIIESNINEINVNINRTEKSSPNYSKEMKNYSKIFSKKERKEDENIEIVLNVDIVENITEKEGTYERKDNLNTEKQKETKNETMSGKLDEGRKNMGKKSEYNSSRIFIESQEKKANDVSKKIEDEVEINSSRISNISGNVDANKEGNNEMAHEVEVTTKKIKSEAANNSSRIFITTDINEVGNNKIAAKVEEITKKIKSEAVNNTNRFVTKNDKGHNRLKDSERGTGNKGSDKTAIATEGKVEKKIETNHKIEKEGNIYEIRMEQQKKKYLNRDSHTDEENENVNAGEKRYSTTSIKKRDGYDGVEKADANYGNEGEIRENDEGESEKREGTSESNSNYSQNVKENSNKIFQVLHTQEANYSIITYHNFSAIDEKREMDKMCNRINRNSGGVPENCSVHKNGEVGKQIDRIDNDAGKITENSSTINHNKGEIIRKFVAFNKTADINFKTINYEGGDAYTIQENSDEVDLNQSNFRVNQTELIENTSSADFLNNTDTNKFQFSNPARISKSTLIKMKSPNNPLINTAAAPYKGNYFQREQIKPETNQALNNESEKLDNPVTFPGKTMITDTRDFEKRNDNGIVRPSNNSAISAAGPGGAHENSRRKQINKSRGRSERVAINPPSHPAIQEDHNGASVDNKTGLKVETLNTGAPFDGGSFNESLRNQSEVEERNNAEMMDERGKFSVDSGWSLNGGLLNGIKRGRVAKDGGINVSESKGDAFDGFRQTSEFNKRRINMETNLENKNESEFSEKNNRLDEIYKANITINQGANEPIENKSNLIINNGILQQSSLKKSHNNITLNLEVKKSITGNNQKHIVGRVASTPTISKNNKNFVDGETTKPETNNNNKNIANKDIIEFAVSNNYKNIVNEEASKPITNKNNKNIIDLEGTKPITNNSSKDIVNAEAIKSATSKNNKKIVDGEARKSTTSKINKNTVNEKTSKSTVSKNMTSGEIKNPTTSNSNQNILNGETTIPATSNNNKNMDIIYMSSIEDVSKIISKNNHQNPPILSDVGTNDYSKVVKNLQGLEAQQDILYIAGKEILSSLKEETSSVSSVDSEFTTQENNTKAYVKTTETGIDLAVQEHHENNSGSKEDNSSFMERFKKNDDSNSKKYSQEEVDSKINDYLEKITDSRIKIGDNKAPNFSKTDVAINDSQKDPKSTNAKTTVDFDLKIISVESSDEISNANIELESNNKDFITYPTRDLSLLGDDETDEIISVKKIVNGINSLNNENLVHHRSERVVINGENTQNSSGAKLTAAEKDSKSSSGEKNIREEYKDFLLDSKNSSEAKLIKEAYKDFLEDSKSSSGAKVIEEEVKGFLNDSKISNEANAIGKEYEGFLDDSKSSSKAKVIGEEDKGSLDDSKSSSETIFIGKVEKNKNSSFEKIIIGKDKGFSESPFVESSTEYAKETLLSILLEKNNSEHFRKQLRKFEPIDEAKNSIGVKLSGDENKRFLEEAAFESSTEYIIKFNDDEINISETKTDDIDEFRQTSNLNNGKFNIKANDERKIGNIEDGLKISDLNNGTRKLKTSKEIKRIGNTHERFKKTDFKDKTVTEFENTTTNSANTFLDGKQTFISKNYIEKLKEKRTVLHSNKIKGIQNIKIKPEINDESEKIKNPIEKEKGFPNPIKGINGDPTDVEHNRLTTEFHENITLRKSVETFEMDSMGNAGNHTIIKMKAIIPEMLTLKNVPIDSALNSKDLSFKETSIEDEIKADESVNRSHLQFHSRREQNAVKNITSKKSEIDYKSEIIPSKTLSKPAGFIIIDPAENLKKMSLRQTNFTSRLFPASAKINATVVIKNITSLLHTASKNVTSETENKSPLQKSPIDFKENVLRIKNLHPSQNVSSNIKIEESDLSKFENSQETIIGNEKLNLDRNKLKERIRTFKGFVKIPEEEEFANESQKYINKVNDILEESKQYDKKANRTILELFKNSSNILNLSKIDRGGKQIQVVNESSVETIGTDKLLIGQKNIQESKNKRFEERLQMFSDEPYNVDKKQMSDSKISLGEAYNAYNEKHDLKNITYVNKRIDGDSLKIRLTKTIQSDKRKNDEGSTNNYPLKIDLTDKTNKNLPSEQNISKNNDISNIFHIFKNITESNARKFIDDEKPTNFQPIKSDIETNTVNLPSNNNSSNIDKINSMEIDSKYQQDPRNNNYFEKIDNKNTSENNDKPILANVNSGNNSSIVRNNANFYSLKKDLENITESFNNSTNVAAINMHEADFSVVNQNKPSKFDEISLKIQDTIQGENLTKILDIIRSLIEEETRLLDLIGKLRTAKNERPPLMRLIATKPAMIKRSRTPASARNDTPTSDSWRTTSAPGGLERVANLLRDQTGEYTTNGSDYKGQASNRAITTAATPTDAAQSRGTFEPQRIEITATSSHFHLTTPASAGEFECRNCSEENAAGATVNETTVPQQTSTGTPTTTATTTSHPNDNYLFTVSTLNTSALQDDLEDYLVTDTAQEMESQLPSANSTMKFANWPVKKEAVVEGDIVLGGLMMVHEREDSITCGPVMPQGGIQALEAMLYTLDRLNEAENMLLPNITLGAHILDDCDKDTYGLEMAVDFIKETLIQLLRQQMASSVR